MSHDSKDWQDDSLPLPPRDAVPSDADLLAWILNSKAGQRGVAAQQAGDPLVQQRVDELDQFLQSCRTELRAEAPASEQRLAELNRRILSSTTREDVTWRGDLRLVRGFLRQRLRSSLLLRVVAASLLLHMVALPVLAYYTWVAPKVEPQVIKFDLSREQLPYRETETEPQPDLSDPNAIDDLDALASRGNAAQILHERLLARGMTDIDLFAAGAPPEVKYWADELDLILRCEQLLDELVRAREPGAAAARPEHLRFALEELQALLREAPDRLGGQVGLRALAASAWLRADAVGASTLDGALRVNCTAWLRAESQGAATQFSSGASWRELLRRAERELAVLQPGGHEPERR